MEPVKLLDLLAWFLYGPNECSTVDSYCRHRLWLFRGEGALNNDHVLGNGQKKKVWEPLLYTVKCFHSQEKSPHAASFPHTLNMSSILYTLLPSTGLTTTPSPLLNTVFRVCSLQQQHHYTATE